MFALPDAIAIAAISAPVCIGIIKLRMKSKSELVDWREYEDFRTEVRERLKSIEHDTHEILVKLGIRS